MEPGTDFLGPVGTIGAPEADAPTMSASGSAAPSPTNTGPVTPVFGERRRSRLPRVSLRAVIFAAAIIALAVAAWFAVAWAAAGSYFVGFEGDEVVIFQGQPDGILLLEPEIVEPTGVTRGALTALDTAIIERGKTVGSLEEAQSYVSELELLRDPIATQPAEPSTTSAQPPQTSIPSAPGGTSGPLETSPSLENEDNPTSSTVP